MEWAQYKIVPYFLIYPNEGDKVQVFTRKGVFKAVYRKFDWTDPSEIAYFDFKEGKNDEVLGWQTLENH